MEPPKSFETSEIKKEKVRIFKQISFTGEAVFGQYVKGEKGNNYTDEQGVNKESKTETYAALKLEINNKRWKGTPFYLRTGKFLKRKASEIAVYFRYPEEKIFKDVKQNVLVVRLQPDEGIYVRFNAKEPGNEFKIQEVSMDFCHECLFGLNTPEAYEKLLQDAFNGDTTLFTRWDEVGAAWKIIDPIMKNKEKQTPVKYVCGTWGPAESDKMLKKSNHHWREPY
jgi:glucose-6-phosphate 1-dehydrogenase